MKKPLLLLVLLALLPAMLMSQTPVRESDVPEAVKVKLGNLFPGYSSAQWTKISTDYQAVLMYDSIKVSARFAESGRWIVSESEYKMNDCPRSMQKHISSNFPSLKTGRIMLVETKDIQEYRVELIDTAATQTQFAYYDVSGTFVRKSDSQGNETDLTLNNADKGKLAVHPKELPSAVNSYCIINYPSHTIKESYIVNNDTYKNAYYLVLQKSDDPVSTELWFDYQGTLIKTGGQQTANNNNTQSGNTEKGNRKKNVRQPVSESKVPGTAVQYFTKKEPKAEEVRWDTIAKEYVVSYYNPAKSIYCRMHFDQKGTFLKSVTVLNPRDLLPLIATYIEENYYNLEIESSENVVYADKKKFTVVKLFNPDWLNDPMVFHEIYFSTSGRLEKEILADYIDAEDVYRKQQDEERDNDFNNYIDQDDLSLDEGGMVDGQIVSYKELPTVTTKYITDHFTGYKFTECIVINDEGVLKYSVFLKREGYSERKRVLFDMKGAFLKEEDI